MTTAPTIDELRDLHRRSTAPVIQALLQGHLAPYGWWLYFEHGKPGTNGLPREDLMLFFRDHDGAPESVALALSQLANSYLVEGGRARNALSLRGSPLPRALILVAPPHKLADGEVVKTFVLTEHQVFLAESPVIEGGKAIRLADIQLGDASLTHNRRPGFLN